MKFSDSRLSKYLRFSYMDRRLIKRIDIKPAQTKAVQPRSGKRKEEKVKSGIGEPHVYNPPRVAHS